MMAHTQLGLLPTQPTCIVQVVWWGVMSQASRQYGLPTIPILLQGDLHMTVAHGEAVVEHTRLEHPTGDH